MRLRWSPQSVEDRKQIYSVIYEHDELAAETMDGLFNSRANSLLSFPAMGRPGRVLDTRELVVHKHYVLVYTYSADFVDIITVLHTSRQYPT